MDDLRIRLKTEADSSTFNSSIKQLESQAPTVNIKARIESVTGLTGLSGKSAQKSADLFKQFDKVSASVDNFKLRLEKLKIQGGLTEEEFDKFNRTVDVLFDEYQSGTKTLFEFDKGLKQVNNDVTLANEINKQHSNSLSSIILKYLKWYAIATAVSVVVNSLKKMVSEVVSLDASMVELNKVFDASNKELERIKNKAFELADGLGTTGKAVIDATTEFKRMGYTIEESLNLAKVATMMTNVAEGIDDAGEAANILTAILKGTGVSTEYAMSLLDRLNEVSNNNAISFDALAHMLQESAATMHILGNNIDETIGMLTGAFAVIQDEKVGKALTTIGLRISGLNEDLEEEAGLANEVSKALQKYAGINVFDEQTGQIKSTYEIMKELSSVWNDLNKNEQAMLLNTLAGKQRADVAAAMLQNWNEVDKAIQDASNSMGSAAHEQEAYLNSIEGKINSFKNAFQKLSDTILDSSLVKGVIDFGTAIVTAIQHVVDFIERLGGLKTIIIELTSVMLMLKAESIATFIVSIGKFIKQIPILISKLVVWTKATWAQFTAEMSLQNALTLGVASVGIIAGIAAVTVAVYELTRTTNDAVESANDMSGSYKDVAETFQTATKRVGEYAKALEKLNKNTKEVLSNGQKLLDDIEKRNDKLKDEKELNEKLLAVEKARQALAEAKTKKARIYRAGIGFVYEEDAEAVQTAQENLEERINELSEFKYEQSLENAKSFMEKLEEILTEGTLVDKWSDLFDEFGDILSDDFKTYLNEINAFVQEYNKKISEMKKSKFGDYSQEELEGLRKQLLIQREILSIGTLPLSAMSSAKDYLKSYGITVSDDFTGTVKDFINSAKEAMTSGKLDPYFSYVITELEAAYKKDVEMVKSLKETNNLIAELDEYLNNLPHYASGTNYHSGGPAIINEKGPELVNLPRGAQIIPHEQSMRLMSMTNSPIINTNKGSNVLQFYGNMEFPNVRGVGDAEGFISELTGLGVATQPR